MKDHDVRKVVWARLEKEHLGQADTLMLDELGILNGSARIDIAVINGEMSGFELKSEKDTLDRLPAQRDFYNLVLDRVCLVVAEAHLEKAAKIIPEWWGVWVAHTNYSGEVEVSAERVSFMNESLDAEAICSLLWREEAIVLLEKYDAARGIKSKPRAAVYERISNALPLDLIRSEVRSLLKSRVGWRVDRRFQ